MNSSHSIEKVAYDLGIWQTYKNTFHILDEDYCILNNMLLQHFLHEDIMQFINTEKKVITDIGIYGENSFQLPFIGYTIKVIKIQENDSNDWENPIELIKVKSSKDIKQIIEELILKYS